MIEVRIGIVDAPKELLLELDESSQDFTKRLDEALTAGSGLMWMDDIKGKHVAVAADKLTYVEIEAETTNRLVGFAP